MSEGEPVGYVVIQAGAASRSVRVEPVHVGEEIQLTGSETVVGVLPAGD